ncbi:MAG: cytochrome bd ubiquinol oxidase subunit [Chloroflexota bacterium]|jgi:cytochrome d ubiquinol oxidase subunit II|nr:cytochrome bd ubiquinol oxidase subunit [Chloroflexota bacterium]
MNVADVWMIFIVLAFGAYIVLDGYDLGVGVLTLLERDDRRRREMYELVARAWDGNESWLVLLAVALFGGLPLAYGIALPALYVPLTLMLLSLIWRGFSIEIIAQYRGWQRGWGLAFGVGSLVAAFSQGAAFGGLAAGVAVHGSSFAGGPFSFLHQGYAVLTGCGAVVLYLLAASAWVYDKSEGELQRRAARAGRVLTLVLAVATAACWALLQPAGTTALDPGAAARLAVWVPGAVVLAGGLAHAHRSFGRHPDAGPVAGVLAVYGGGLILAIGLLYPSVVPPHVTVHAAASPAGSLTFLLIGVGLSMPAILAYNAYAYWAFRGKLPQTDGVAGTAPDGAGSEVAAG